jgi:hypothetical protein
MAQLIKIQDYVSRYEQDIYRYPPQFIKLKKQQWDKVKAAYLAGELEQLFNQSDENQRMNLLHEEEKKTFFHKVKGMFRRTKDDEVEAESTAPTKENNIFSLHIPTATASLDELKHTFLNQLLRFQMKWGSSTIHEKSFIDSSFFLDEKLRFFLQRFPDTFLVMYKPVFRLKKAPVEVDVIVLTPTDAWCITFLEAEEDAAFVGSSERFWLRRHHKHLDKKVLNPFLAVNRMEKIVSQLFDLYEVTLPIKKVVLTRNGYIDYPLAPYDIELLDKRSFPSWFEKIRKVSAPLKHQQLKGAQALLDYCQTTSTKRIEWEIEDAAIVEEDKN